MERFLININNELGNWGASSGNSSQKICLPRKKWSLYLHAMHGVASKLIAEEEVNNSF